MCFSPTASFIAGGALGIAGIHALKRARKPSERPFAAIPLLFGVQQVIEGFVWLTFGQPFPHGAATYAYVLFSHVLWPAYLPSAVWALEPDRRRKKWIVPFALIGCVVGATLLAYVVRGPVTSSVIGHCIAYEVPLPSVPAGLWAYVLATVGTCFVSSRTFVRAFGIALLGALCAAYWSYREAFYSVWCFFAAALSFIVIVQLRQESKLP